MDALTRRFTTSMRARPSRPCASATIARNFLAPREEQSSGSARHDRRISASVPICCSTRRHLTHNSPSGARNVASPNGSWLRGGRLVVRGLGASLVVPAGPTAANLAVSPGLRPSYAASTWLIVKNRTGAGALEGAAVDSAG